MMAFMRALVPETPHRLKRLRNQSEQRPNTPPPKRTVALRIPTIFHEERKPRREDRTRVV